MTAEPNAPAVTPDAPWLGLRSFTEETRGYFFGRDAEVRDLYDRVSHRHLTVFFGQSGLGKTSVLRAGLVPRLRENGFVPVVLRMDWSAQDPEPELQVLKGLRKALYAAGSDRLRALAKFPKDVSLWQLLHDPRMGFLSRVEDVAPPRVVFLFDQFEEIFTLGQKHPDRVLEWREQLAALVENRLPVDMREKLERNPDLLGRYQLRAAPARFLLTLRHDFLHVLERWREQIPSLMDNRLELTMLRGPQALQAVLFPGRLRADRLPLVDEQTGASLVRFVAGAPPDKPLTEIEAVPPLLSLVCAELNNQRLAAKAPRIVFDLFFGEPPALSKFIRSLPQDAAGVHQPIPLSVAHRALRELGLDDGAIERSLDRLASKGLLIIKGEGDTAAIHLSAELTQLSGRDGTEILQGFYSASLAPFPGTVRIWFEELFISPEGFRQTVNLDTALVSLKATALSDPEARRILDDLVASRLLTIEDHAAVSRLELAHDVLAPIVRESRDRRRKQEARDRIGLAAVTQARGGLQRGEAHLPVMRPDDWDHLMAMMELGDVIPVVGPHAITCGHEDQSVYAALLQRIAGELGVSAELQGGATLEEVLALLNRRSGDESSYAVRFALDAIEVSGAGSTSRMLASVNGFKLFVNTSSDRLFERALQEERNGDILVSGFPSDRYGQIDKQLEEIQSRSASCLRFSSRFRMGPALGAASLGEACLELIATSEDALTRIVRHKALLFLGVNLRQEPLWLLPWVLLRHTGNPVVTELERLIPMTRGLPADCGIYFPPSHWPVLSGGDSREFIREISARWQAVHGGGQRDVGNRPALGESTVFISYSRGDFAAAERIARLLESRGVAVWLDRDQLHMGDSFLTQTRAAIDRCSVFISLISRDSESRSEGFFIRERRQAAERLSRMRNVRFYIPIVLDDVAPPFRAEPPEVNELNVARAPHGDLSDRDVEEIIRAIRDRMR